MRLAVLDGSLVQLLSKTFLLQGGRLKRNSLHLFSMSPCRFVCSIWLTAHKSDFERWNMIVQCPHHMRCRLFWRGQYQPMTDVQIGALLSYHLIVCASFGSRAKVCDAPLYNIIGILQELLNSDFLELIHENDRPRVAHKLASLVTPPCPVDSPDDMLLSSCFQTRINRRLGGPSSSIFFSFVLPTSLPAIFSMGSMLASLVESFPKSGTPLQPQVCLGQVHGDLQPNCAYVLHRAE